mgnify:CR=1 FL=1
MSSSWDCAKTPSSKPEPPDWGTLPRLGALSSQSSEAALFLPWVEETLTSPSFLSSDDGILIPPDTMSDIPSGWRPPLVLPLYALSSFTGIWYGAGASILVSTGSAESSGRGAEHLIRSAFFIQPWKKIVCSVTYYGILNYKVFGS